MRKLVQAIVSVLNWITGAVIFATAIIILVIMKKHNLI